MGFALLDVLKYSGCTMDKRLVCDFVLHISAVVLFARVIPVCFLLYHQRFVDYQSCSEFLSWSLFVEFVTAMCVVKTGAC
jgi:hypothetical protein